MNVLWISAFSFLLVLIGCRPENPRPVSISPNRLLESQFNDPPHNRRGSYATPTLGTTYLDPDHLGLHNYSFGLLEKNGIVYTCKGGHIDISHVREAADWTSFLASTTYKHLIRNDTDFSFKLKEGSICFVHLEYPDTWQDLTDSDKNAVAFDVAVRLGQYFGYTAGTWHEILTWFGYKSKGVFPEFPSAFSWEDTFSNLLGSYIGAAALRDTTHTYNEAVTIYINKELEKLDVRSAEVAKSAAQKVRGKWFSGVVPPFVDMKGRNFDTGLDDGYVTPWTVSSVGECEDQKAQPYPVPKLDFLGEYGFSIRFEIQPRVWEGKKIIKIACQGEEYKKRYIDPRNLP